MKTVNLTYGNDGFKEIAEYLQQFRKEHFTLSIYNIMEQNTTQIICPFNDILNVIRLVSNIEHDYPAWIEINETTDSYVIGMNLTRGKIKTASIYEYKNGMLNQK